MGRDVKMKDRLKQICSLLDIEYVGVIPPGPYNDLGKILQKRLKEGCLSGMDKDGIKTAIDARNFLKEAKSVIVCLFPYYSGDIANSNIAMYARSIDYHKTIIGMLENICEKLGEYICDFKYEAYTDKGPMIDRYLAWKAGLGFYGLNSQIINEKYGSYVMIGYIITNYPFEFDSPVNKECHRCYNCISSCPGNAIGDKFDFSLHKCVSYITQKKGELSEEEARLVSEHNMVYGCDVCQRVCPHNKDIPITPLACFNENLITSLNWDDIENLSNRKFRKAYGDRAFSWRGRSVIERNMKLKPK